MGIPFHPLYTGGLFHWYIVDESICHFRGVKSNFVAFNLFLMENPLRKHCGSAMFVYDPFTRFQVIMGFQDTAFSVATQFSCLKIFRSVLRAVIIVSFWSEHSMIRLFLVHTCQKSPFLIMCLLFTMHLMFIFSIPIESELHIIYSNVLIP